MVMECLGRHEPFPPAVRKEAIGRKRASSIHRFISDLKGDPMSKRAYSFLFLALFPGLAPAAPAEAPQAVAQPYLGVTLAPAGAGQAGCLIRMVDRDSPAHRAGLKPGDCLVQIGDQPVNDPQSVVDCVTRSKPGDRLVCRVWRDGKEEKVEVTVGQRSAALPPRLGELLARQPAPFLGIWTRELTDDLKKRVGVENGAVIARVMPDTPAAKAGLEPNDVIIAVNGRAIAKPQELLETIAQAKAGADCTIQVMRGKEMKELKVRLGEMPFHLGWLRHRGPGVDLLDDAFTLPPGLDTQLKQRLEQLHQRLRELEKRLEPRPGAE
jgi:predicted metalloprotease with PDZ domain